MAQKPYAVVFVCLGNICRSPLAAGVFRDLVRAHGFEEFFHIESRGTGGWHAGEKAHATTRRVAKARGVSLESHRAKQFTATDFGEFDLVLAMDSENYQNLLATRGADRAKLKRLREFDPEPDDGDVPDPYYEAVDGFEEVHDIVDRCCKSLLEFLDKKLTLSRK